MRWIVGDLQGCAREFESLLEKIRFDPGRDELWAAGDLINRGPETLAAVRLWRDVGGRGVIGNHEIYALCVRAGLWPRKSDTLDALFDAPDGDALLDALRALPVLAHLPRPDERGDVPEAWVVHGGVHPRWTDLHAVARAINDVPHDDAWLERDEVSWATRVRCCDADGNRTRHHQAPEDCPAPYRPWDEFYDGEATVVHGHWAWRGHYRKPNVIGLDSACVYGGELTAWCQDEDRIVSVPCARSGGYC